MSDFTEHQNNFSFLNYLIYKNQLYKQKKIKLKFVNIVFSLLGFCEKSGFNVKGFI